MRKSLKEKIEELEDKPLDVRSGVPIKRKVRPPSDKSGSVNPT